MTITAQSIKLRFPEFAELDDSVVQFAVDEAAQGVDDSWIETDKALAQSYLAAHFLAVSESSSDVGGRTITSESIGIISASYGAVSGNTGSSTLVETTYGKRYLSYARRSNPPVAIV